MDYTDLVKRAGGFHSWDAMSPAALNAIVKRGPFKLSAETGCGGSTIVFSQISEKHIAFAIEGKDQTISELRAHPSLRADTVVFVEGETRKTVPCYEVGGTLDLVLLDGPHAYPLPQVEFVHLFPRIRIGGWLVIDEIQIPSVNELFVFLKGEPTVLLEEVVVRTAFFRRVKVVDNGPDGWQFQSMNRRTVWRYSWRDRLRSLIKRCLGAMRSGPT
jgi:hypothetical protein